MNVFLTGGTGFIGMPLAQKLIDKGWTVYALVRRPDSAQARQLSAMGAHCVAGDVTERGSMREAMTGADIVIHNAGVYEFGLLEKERQVMYAINVKGTENVLSLALELGIPRTVYVSTALYFGETGPEPKDESFRRRAPFHTYYEQTKTEAHEIALGIQQQGLPLSIICPCAVAGPNDHSIFGYLARLYLNGLLPPFAWGPEVKNATVHVEDVANGIVLAAEKGRMGETYILAGEAFSTREMLNLWLERPGGSRFKIFLPAPLMSVILGSMEPLLRMLGLPAFLSRESVAANMYVVFTPEKAQRELGWTYRPARTMWLEILDQERELMKKREKRDLISRLKPV